MPAQNHIHRYRRAIGRLTEANKASGFVNYYKCDLGNCTHRERAELILGKQSICNRCGKEFILPRALRMLRNIPHCKACTKKYTKTATEIKQLDDIIEMEMEQNNG